MATITAYFIPTQKESVGQFTEKVKAVLEKLNLINGYYNVEYKMYAHGQAFEFEYAMIHDTDKRKLVPEALTTGYGAKCIQCNTDIEDEFYEVITEYYNNETDMGEEKDMAELPLTCNSCNRVMELQNIKYGQPVIFTSHFFQFVEIDDVIPDTLLRQLEQELDTELTIIYERM